MQAKRIIEEEHRSLAAVLYGMLYVVREIRYVGIKPDFALLEAMVHYVDTFLERLHHPKEDAFLFKLLGSRYPGAAPLLDRLKQEHESGSLKLRQLRQALTRSLSQLSEQVVRFETERQRLIAKEPELRATMFDDFRRNSRRFCGISLGAHAARGN